MTLEGWIFMVGLRVVDVGGFCAWLFWFFRIRDDTTDDLVDEDEGGEEFRPRWGQADPEPDPRPSPSGFELPLGDSSPWPHRRRDHAGDRPATPAVRPGRAPRPIPERRPAEPSRRG